MTWLGCISNAHGRAVDLGLDDVKARIDGPREVVHVLGDEVQCLGAVAVVVLVAQHAGRADHPVARHGQRDVVDAEVGEELGGEMVLMAVPRAVLVHPDLREPLPDERERSGVAGARRDARQLGDELDVDLHCPPCRTGVSSGRRTTVRSSMLSSSGWTNCKAGRSSRPAIRMDVMAMYPQPCGCSRSHSTHCSPAARTNDERLLAKALR